MTVICSDRAKDFILKHFMVKPKSVFSDLVAVSAGLSEEFQKTTNSYFALLSPVAAKRIAICQIISTPTEVSLIVKREDLEQTMRALNGYFTKEKNENR